MIMVGDMRWFSENISEVMNSKLYTILLPQVSGKVKILTC